MDKDNFNANVDFVRGQADMIVLSALSDGDKYGLEILSTIQERSKGMYSLKQATLYSSLKRLEKNGYVHSYDGEYSNGAKRVYYGLTQMGREHLDNDKSYWEFCNFLMSNLISDNKFDPQNEDKPFDPAEFRPLTRRARGEKEDKEQEKEKEVVVKYVYVKADDIPEGADIVYVSPENVEKIENDSPAVTDTDESVETENIENAVEESSQIEEVRDITTLSADSDEYQPSFILIDGDEVAAEYESDSSSEQTLNEIAIIGIDDDALSDTQEQAEIAEIINETTTDTENETALQTDEVADESQGQEYDCLTEDCFVDRASDDIEAIAQEYLTEELSVEENIEDIIDESLEEEIIEEVVDTEQSAEDIYYEASDGTDIEQTETETDTENVDNIESDTYGSSFADRPLRNTTSPDTSSSFASMFAGYTRENDVNYVESFNELFDVEDEEDYVEEDTGADIEFLTMKEMVYKYQSKGITIKPYDKQNTMEYYVNRYYFSNKLQFHASLIIFAIFAVELFLAHFICNRGENKLSGLWLLIIFALAIFPAIRGVMYVIDPTRKSLANYNPKTSILVSLLPVVTFPIVFALMAFVEFGANINDYMSMERTIILPSVLLFNVPLFSIIYTLLYRTYKYHVN